MKIAFIGAGAVFEFHHQQWCHAAPEGSEFFVVEPDDQRAQVRGMQRLDLEHALESCDLAIINTPSYVRWRVCEPFIKRGIPIVVEKPLAINWNEINSFEATSGWVCPVVNARVLTKIEHMKQEAKNIKYLHSFKERYRAPGYYDDWHGKYATDGGVLAQQGFHCLDLVCWFGGTPLEVSAIGERRLHKIECEDTATVKIKFASGAEGSVWCTTAGQNGKAGLYVESAEGIFSTEATVFAGGKPGHTILAQRVFAALQKGEPPPITVESMIPSLRALHAAYVSMDRGGAWIAVGERHQKLGQL